jgi:hypothetical protein
MANTLYRFVALACVLPVTGAGILAQTPAQFASPIPPGASAAEVRSLGLERQSRALPLLNPQAASPLQPLLDFKESDIKFNLQVLMNMLRDNRHEGWVLAAYPDPKTTRPLIGAGFSLDLPARAHPQRDPLNPNMFLEPSSAELWQAAGLPPQRLQAMLEEFDRDLAAWRKKKFQRKARTHDLFPQISEEDALKLLRISAIQAIHNARAYCRNFDKLAGPQQMALSQLVFQMGVNLEQFTQFLWAVNNPPAYPYATQGPGIQLVAEDSDPQLAAAAMMGASDTEYWKAVQASLIHSDWARRYSTRAVSVIAMFDPAYERAPWEAEATVRAQVHPLHRSRRHAAGVHTASASRKKTATRRTHKS